MRTSSYLPPCLLISPKPFHSWDLRSHFRPCKLKTLNIKHWLSGCYSWAKISPKFSSEKKQQCERWTVEVQWRREQDTNTREGFIGAAEKGRKSGNLRTEEDAKSRAGQLHLTETLDNGHPWHSRLWQEAEEKHGTHTILTLLLIQQ